MSQEILTKIETLKKGLNNPHISDAFKPKMREQIELLEAQLKVEKQEKIDIQEVINQRLLMAELQTEELLSIKNQIDKMMLDNVAKMFVNRDKQETHAHALLFIINRLNNSPIGIEIPVNVIPSEQEIKQSVKKTLLLTQETKHGARDFIKKGNVFRLDEFDFFIKSTDFNSVELVYFDGSPYKTFSIDEFKGLINSQKIVHQPKTTLTKHEELALKLMPKSQALAVKEMPVKTRKQQLTDLTKAIVKAPKLYESDKGAESTVYFHYFSPSSDWYVTEIEYFEETNEFDAYGYAVLNKDFEMAEFGYLPINEIINSKPSVKAPNLDMYWNLKTVAQAVPENFETPTVTDDLISVELPVLSEAELRQIGSDYAYVTSEDEDRAIDWLLDPDYTYTLAQKYIREIDAWEKKHKTSVNTKFIYAERYADFLGVMEADQNNVELSIGQRYAAKNGDVLEIADFDIEDHVTLNDRKGKLSSLGIQRISVFKQMVIDGELTLLTDIDEAKVTFNTGDIVLVKESNSLAIVIEADNNAVTVEPASSDVYEYFPSAKKSKLKKQRFEFSEIENTGVSISDEDLPDFQDLPKYKTVDSAQKKHNIVIEWSDALAEENYGVEDLTQLNELLVLLDADNDLRDTVSVDVQLHFKQTPVLIKLGVKDFDTKSMSITEYLHQNNPEIFTGPDKLSESEKMWLERPKYKTLNEAILNHPIVVTTSEISEFDNVGFDNFEQLQVAVNDSAKLYAKSDMYDKIWIALAAKPLKPNLPNNPELKLYIDREFTTYYEQDVERLVMDQLKNNYELKIPVKTTQVKQSPKKDVQHIVQKYVSKGHSKKSAELLALYEKLLTENNIEFEHLILDGKISEKVREELSLQSNVQVDIKYAAFLKQFAKQIIGKETAVKSANKLTQAERDKLKSAFERYRLTGKLD
jgi:hypothetical protein